MGIDLENRRCYRNCFRKFLREKGLLIGNFRLFDAETKKNRRSVNKSVSKVK
jgi:hypothetical protein